MSMCTSCACVPGSEEKKKKIRAVELIPNYIPVQFRGTGKNQRVEFFFFFGTAIATVNESRAEQSKP